MDHKWLWATATAMAMLALLAGCRPNQETAAMADRDTNPTAPESENADDRDHQVATFAAGCFWGVEATFRDVEGVIETEVGYTGGHTENPSYEEVCRGDTGHAEAVRVVYDPEQLSYEDLLEVFWNSHNPTTPNRQGPDVGEQYRSAIFYHTEDQREAAEASRRRLEASDAYDRSVVTEITEAGPWYRAEQYHQRYLEKKGRASCSSTVR